MAEMSCLDIHTRIRVHYTEEPMIQIPGETEYRTTKLVYVDFCVTHVTGFRAILCDSRYWFQSYTMWPTLLVSELYCVTHVIGFRAIQVNAEFYYLRIWNRHELWRRDYCSWIRLQIIRICNSFLAFKDHRKITLNVINLSLCANRMNK